MSNRTARLFESVSYRNAAGETANVVVLGKQSAAPAAADFTVTGSITDGTLAAATYTYKVSVVVDGIETAASTTKADAVDSGTTGSVVIDATDVLAAFPTATTWKVYGRTGTQLLIATVTAPTATYLDTGAVTPSGASKSANSAIRFKNIGTGVVQTQVGLATADKQTGVYYNR